MKIRRPTACRTRTPVAASSPRTALWRLHRNLLLFVVGSVVCAQATDVYWITIGRAIQGHWRRAAAHRSAL